jgi:hypothetical protein
LYEFGKIPDYMRGGIRRYVEKGVRPGDFLTAVFENNLMKAAMYADGTNIQLLLEYARLLYNLPGNCYGSEKAVKEWCKKGGLEGIMKARRDEEERDG